MPEPDAEAIINALDPTPAAEALGVSRRAVLAALAGAGSVAATGTASAQAGTVTAGEAFLAGYDSTSTASGYELTVDGDTYSFDGSEEIGLPDGSVATTPVAPGGAGVGEIRAPDGSLLWEVGVLFEQTTMSHARQFHTTAVVDGQPYVFRPRRQLRRPRHRRVLRRLDVAIAAR